MHHKSPPKIWEQLEIALDIRPGRILGFSELFASANSK